MSKPSIVLVHGSFHMPANYALLCKHLIYGYGYRVVAPSLPSVGAMPGVPSIAQDVESVRMAVELEMVMGNDVVVVAHSYGGFVTTNALYGLMKNASVGEDKVEGQPRVVKLIHVASMVPFIGMNTGDVMKQADTGVERDEVGNPPGMNIDKENDVSLAGPPEGVDLEVATEGAIQFLYHDVPRDTALATIAGMRCQSQAPLRHKTDFEAWQFAPNTYIHCTADRAFPLVLQENQVKKMREAGSSVETVVLDSSHSPFLSMPDRLAAVIVKAVEKR